MLAQAAEHDVVHLVAKSGEAAELVESASASIPEEFVRVRGQLAPVRAQSKSRIGTMFVEILADEAVLEHASERQGQAAWRPAQLSRHQKIGADEHYGAHG